MKKLLFILPVLLVMSVAFTSCYFDKESELYPATSTCSDTANVTYNSSIVNIMKMNCNKCHSTSAHAGSVITDTYAGVSAIAANGSLDNAVNQGIMPKDEQKLSTCDLYKINKWVSAGYPNN